MGSEAGRPNISWLSVLTRSVATLSWHVGILELCGPMSLHREGSQKELEMPPVTKQCSKLELRYRRSSRGSVIFNIFAGLPFRILPIP
jgi:hypothetical protein